MDIIIFYVMEHAFLIHIFIYAGICVLSIFLRVMNTYFSLSALYTMEHSLCLLVCACVCMSAYVCMCVWFKASLLPDVCVCVCVSVCVCADNTTIE